MTPKSSENAAKNVMNLNLNRNFNLKFTESFDLQLQMEFIQKINRWDTRDDNKIESQL